MLDPRPSPSFHFPSTPKGVFIPPFIPRQGAFGGQMCRPNRSPMSGRRACFFGKPYAKRLFSATSFGGGPVSTSKMAKLPGAFCIFGKLVGVSFLQFSGGHSCTRLLVSSGLFFVLPCLSKNSRTARSIHEIPWIAPAEASRPPTSQNYRVLHAKMAVGTKKPSFLRVLHS